MAKTAITQLKNWFNNGLKPAQEHFWNWMDSYWHKDEAIPTNAVEGLDEYFNQVTLQISEIGNYAKKDASNLSEENIISWKTALEISARTDESVVITSTTLFHTLTTDTNQKELNEEVDYNLTNIYLDLANLESAISEGVKTPLPLDCSVNPDYPASNKGDSYKVTVAGKVGGSSGLAVEVGDMIICINDNVGGTEAAVGAYFFIIQTNLDQATESVAGFAKIATTAQTTAGTDDSTIVTPKKLHEKLTSEQGSVSIKSVRYDVPQTLTAPQRTQGRKNIDAADDAEVVKIVDIQTIGGIKTFSTIPILPNSNPIIDNQAVRKKYVDDNATRVFTGLTDAPSTYTGSEGKLVAVKKTADGLEFVDNTLFYDMSIMCTKAGEDISPLTNAAEFRVPFKMQVKGVVATVVSAPTGQAIKLSFAVNGTFVGVSNIWLQIDSNATIGENTIDFTDTILQKGDVLKIYIDQVGSTLTGSGLLVNFNYIKL